MPCYDKKLEAVRPDFKFAADETKAKEVDTVLATHEIIDLFDKLGVNFVDVQPFEDTIEEQKQDNLSLLLKLSNNPVKFNIDTLFGRTSNGYLEYIFRRAANELFGIEIAATTPLVYKQGKNKHYQEVTYPGVDLKFVQAYGFQHI